MRKEKLESTNRLLRVIVALLLRRQESEILSLRQQIEILNNLKLKSPEIGQILGRSNNYIHKELSGLKKTRKQKKINL